MVLNGAVVPVTPDDVGNLPAVPRLSHGTGLAGGAGGVPGVQLLSLEAYVAGPGARVVVLDLGVDAGVERPDRTEQAAQLGDDLCAVQLLGQREVQRTADAQRLDGFLGLSVQVVAVLQGIPSTTTKETPSGASSGKISISTFSSMGLDLRLAVILLLVMGYNTMRKPVG